LLLAAVVIVVCSLSKFNRAVHFVSLIAVVIHIGFSIVFIRTQGTGVYSIVDETFSFDTFAAWIKLITSLAALMTIAMSRGQKMEYYLLLLAILLGADLLAMSSSFIMILLSIEMISLSSYVLTAGTLPDKARAEAAWKFFIYGSAATAVMIFGMSYLFGATGSILRLSEYRSTEPTLMFSIGAFMMLAGFLFKMTAAPFHLWAPDVYQATPAPVVAFLSVVPKLAGFTAIINSIGYIGMKFTTVIAVVSILSISVGTLAPLSQTDAKRMMEYSSVAQAGFLLIIPVSIIDFSAITLNLTIFYSFVFMLMNYVVFIVIHAREQSGNETSITSFSGIGYTTPFAAIAVTLGLVSLAGIPPVAGFMAKLMVFSALWAKFNGAQNIAHLALFVIGLFATVASLFFYLKIPFYAFLRRAEGRPPIKITPFTNLLLLILVGLLLTLFLIPGLLMGW